MKYQYTDQLSSGRLSTRFLEPGYAEKWTPFVTDPEASRFAPDLGDLDPADKAAIWIEKQLLRYEKKRYGLQAIHRKSDGAFVGLCGLLLQELEGRQYLETGYHMLPQFWGNGYAPEAARIFLEYAFNNMISDQVVSIIHQDNQRSQRVAKKNGLTSTGLIDWHGEKAMLFAVTAEEFRRQSP